MQGNGSREEGMSRKDFESEPTDMQNKGPRNFVVLISVFVSLLLIGAVSFAITWSNASHLAERVQDLQEGLGAKFEENHVNRMEFRQDLATERKQCEASSEKEKVEFRAQSAKLEGCTQKSSAVASDARVLTTTLKHCHEANATCQDSLRLQKSEFEGKLKAKEEQLENLRNKHRAELLEHGNVCQAAHLVEKNEFRQEKQELQRQLMIAQICVGVAVGVIILGGGIALWLSRPKRQQRAVPNKAKVGSAAAPDAATTPSNRVRAWEAGAKLPSATHESTSLGTGTTETNSSGDFDLLTGEFKEAASQ